MRWPSFRASILKRVLGGQSNKFTWSTSISDSQDPPRPFFIILPETGQWDLSRRLHLSSLLIINMFFQLIFLILNRKTLKIDVILSKKWQKSYVFRLKTGNLWSKIGSHFLSKKRWFLVENCLFRWVHELQLLKNDDWSD